MEEKDLDWEIGNALIQGKQTTGNGEYCRQRWSVGEGKSGAFEGGSGFQIFVSMLVVALSTVPMLVAARRSIETIGCSSVGTEQAASNQLVLSAAHQSLRI